MPRRKWKKEPITYDWMLSRTIADGECRLWIGALNNKGYGQLGVNGQQTLAHRAAFELVHGPIPDGMEACHTCDRPACIFVGHLFLGTHAENLQDAAQKGRFQTGANHWSARLPERVARGDARHAPRGEQVKNAKLTEEQTSEIRSRYIYGYGLRSAEKLAHEFGVSKSTVLNIVAGRSWSKPPFRKES